MGQEKKKSGMFAKIQSRDDAIKVARDCGAGFWVVAGIQAALSFLVGYSVLFDAAVYTICGYFIRSKYSRVASVVVLLLALGALVVTFLNKMGQNLGGGNNIFLALIIAWAAVRSVEATFKLHGRFKETDVVPNT